MSKQFKQKLIIAVIGTIGVILAALIMSRPQLLKSDTNEINAKIEEIKKEQDLIRSEFKPEFKEGTKEDAYLAAVIDCLSEFLEIKQGIKISSQFNEIRASMNYEFSNDLFVRKVVNKKDDLFEWNIFLHISQEKEGKIINEIVHVKNAVLQNVPEEFSFQEIEHIINKAGAYIVGSEFINEKGKHYCAITMRFPLPEDSTREYIEISGDGIFFNKK